MYRTSFSLLLLVLVAIPVSSQGRYTEMVPNGKSGSDGTRAVRSRKQISGGVLNKLATSLPEPSYPSAASAVRASGEVKVRVVIDETGKVTSAEAVEGHPLLRAAAAKAAQSARFLPTTENGESVWVSGILIYNFGSTNALDPLSASPEAPTTVSGPIWGIGFFAGIAQTADRGVLMEVDATEKQLGYMIKFLATDAGVNVAPYESALEKLDTPDIAGRSLAARDFLVRVRKEFRPEQNWQIDAGEQVGLLAAELFHVRTQSFSWISSPTDDRIMRAHLTKLAALVAAAPPKVPAPTKRQFREIAAYSKVSGLTTEAKFTELWSLVIPLLNEFK